MKKFNLIMAALILAACSSESNQIAINDEPSTVTMTFTPYDVEPMTTRVATSIADFCTHLDVWITDGTTTTDIHQSSTSTDFGELSVTLNKTKTYTLYAVAHRCATDATLADGIISFPDDKVTHSMFYSTTFSPSTTTSLSCLMDRIVAQFRFETTDAIPDEAKKMQFTINSVYDRWHVTAGGTHGLDRTSTVNISSKNNDGTAIFNIYAITTGAQTLHSVTVTALDENDDPIRSRTFTNVPLRNGYRTTYRGTFFTDAPVSAAFTVDDWSEYDTVTF